MLTQLASLSMKVRGFPACRSFYGDRLGLKEVGHGAGGNGRRRSLFRAGPSTLELLEDPDAPLPEDASDAARPAINHFAFFVDDIDAVYSQLLDRGVEFRTPPEMTPSGHRNAQRSLLNLKDPSGYALQISETVDNHEGESERMAAKRKMASDGGDGLFGGVDHIAMYCTDFGDTRAFYGDSLGLNLFFHSTTREEGLALAPGFEQGAFAIGGTDLEMATDETWSDIRPGVVHELGFRADDVDEVYRTLQSMGIRPAAPPGKLNSVAGDESYGFVLCDPDGMVVQITEPQ
jgi:catechol 2,3-dioxygenase-like lactoylglutathione lyase family enzyme